jgi:hypothetical protein
MYRQHFSHSVSAIFIAAALAVSIESKAAPVFPPEHLDQRARFAAAPQTEAVTGSRPWYFLAQPARRAPVSEAMQPAPELASNASVSPWYRPAN